MSDDNKYITAHDLLGLAIDQKPLDFADAFNDLLLDRIYNKIDDKKIEVAQSMFTQSEAEEEIEDTEEE